MDILATRRRARGFTLLELLCALAVAGVLSAIALPGYRHVVHKARRTDATLTLVEKHKQKTALYEETLPRTVMAESDYREAKQLIKLG